MTSEHYRDYYSTSSSISMELTTIRMEMQKLNTQEIPIAEIKIHKNQKLGQGQFGVVYESEYQGERVAAKITYKGENFLRELRNLRICQSPYVLKLYGAFIVEEITLAYGLVVELMELDLENLLKKSAINATKLPQSQVIQMALEIASGMEAVHSKQIIHRDLRPANILVKNNHCFLSDFGIARHENTVTSQVFPPKYYSPEFVAKDQLTRKSDVYQYALTLWQLLTCEPLFPDLSNETVKLQICANDLRPSLEILPQNVSKSLIKLMTICWHRNPILRPEFTAIVLYLQELKI